MDLFNLYAKIAIDTSDYEKGAENAKKSSSQLKSDVMKLAQTYKKEGMSMSDAMKKAYGQIDKSQYETAENSEKDSRKFSGNWKEATSSIKASTIAAGNFLYDMAKSAANVIGSLAKIGLDYNSQMETYTTNFKVMLGSTEDAVAKVEELKTMAASTPFGMSDLADATQTLLSFQVPAEQTTGILKQLGDISLGNSEKLSGLALVFGQVSSAGKLTGQDLMQFINQGFNPLNYIAERTGESMEELRDRMSKGAIGTDEIKQAFIDATSEGGQFFNGMEEGSKTTEGLISTLKDNINAKLGEAFQNVSDILKNDLLPRAIEFVNSIDVEKIVSSIEGALEAFKNLIPVISAVGAGFATWNVANKITGLVQSVSALGGVLPAVATGIQLIKAAVSANWIGIIVTAIAAVVTALVVLWNTNEDFRNAVAEVWSAIVDIVSNVAESIGRFFTETIPNSFNNAVNFFKSVPQFFDNIFNSIGERFSFGWEKLKESTSDGAKQISESIKTGLKNLPYNAGVVFGTVLKKIQDWGVEVKNWISSELPRIVLSILDWFAKLPGRIEQKLSETIQKIVSWGDSAIQTARKKASEIIAAVIDWFKRLPGLVWEWLQETVKKVINWGKNMVDTAKEKIGEFVENVVTAIKELPGKVVEVGANIVNGIWEGIKNGWEAFKENVNNLIDGFVGGVKDALGIHSPSTVFEAVGKFSAMGVSVGWEKEFEKVKNNITSGFDFGTATVGVSSSYSGAGGSAGGQPGSNQTAQPADIVINLVSEMDGTTLARKLFRYSQREQRIQGESLVGVN